MNEKIRELFEKTGLEQVLLFNNLIEQPYFHYFTSLPLNQFQGNALLLRKGKKPLVASTFLEYDLVKKISGLNAVKIEKKRDFIELVKKEMPKKKIGVNYSEHSIASLARLKRKLKRKKLVNVSKELQKLRETKTREEIKKISRAVKITERAIESIPSIFKKGMSERELALKLEFKILESKAGATSFPIIVASGRRSAIPHYITSNKKIRKGFLLVDFGARYKNYCADLSRTFFVGKAGKKEKEAYEIVYDAKIEAEEKAKPRVKAAVLFNATDSVLKKAGFKMVHALGHGIGLQDHDFPAGISKKSNWKLKERMCIAIEPAVYGKFGGVRIEDNYLIERNSCKNLSIAPRELIEI